MHDGWEVTKMMLALGMFVLCARRAATPGRQRESRLSLAVKIPVSVNETRFGFLGVGEENITRGVLYPERPAAS